MQRNIRVSDLEMGLHIKTFLRTEYWSWALKTMIFVSERFFLPIFTETIGQNLELCIILNAWSF